VREIREHRKIREIPKSKAVFGQLTGLVQNLSKNPLIGRLKKIKKSPLSQYRKSNKSMDTGKYWEIPESALRCPETH
jgi:hypothetical protein